MTLAEWVQRAHEALKDANECANQEKVAKAATHFNAAADWFEKCVKKVEDEGTRAFYMRSAAVCREQGILHNHIASLAKGHPGAVYQRDRPQSSADESTDPISDKPEREADRNGSADVGVRSIVPPAFSPRSTEDKVQSQEHRDMPDQHPDLTTSPHHGGVLGSTLDNEHDRSAFEAAQQYFSEDDGAGFRRAGISHHSLGSPTVDFQRQCVVLDKQNRLLRHQQALLLDICTRLVQSKERQDEAHAVFYNIVIQKMQLHNDIAHMPESDRLGRIKQILLDNASRRDDYQRLTESIIQEHYVSTNDLERAKRACAERVQQIGQLNPPSPPRNSPSTPFMSPEGAFAAFNAPAADMVRGVADALASLSTLPQPHANLSPPTTLSAAHIHSSAQHLQSIPDSVPHEMLQSAPDPAFDAATLASADTLGLHEHIGDGEMGSLLNSTILQQRAAKREGTK